MHLAEIKEYEWVFQAAIALGTLLAVLVALFGDWLKGRWFRPSLELRLASARGILQQVNIQTPEGPVVAAVARYYHLEVRNSARWPIATQVQVYLLRIEEPRVDGQLAIIWEGELPMPWRNQNVSPIARSVGPQAQADLVHVMNLGWVTVATLVLPLGFPMHERRGAMKDVVLSLQARAAEADSQIKRISISWNGQWADGESEMANNFVVKVVEPPPRPSISVGISLR